MLVEFYSVIKEEPVVSQRGSVIEGERTAPSPCTEQTALIVNVIRAMFSNNLILTIRTRRCGAM